MDHNELDNGLTKPLSLDKMLMDKAQLSDKIIAHIIYGGGFEFGVPTEDTFEIDGFSQVQKWLNQFLLNIHYDSIHGQSGSQCNFTFNYHHKDIYMIGWTTCIEDCGYDSNGFIKIYYPDLSKFPEKQLELSNIVQEIEQEKCIHPSFQKMTGYQVYVKKFLINGVGFREVAASWKSLTNLEKQEYHNLSRLNNIDNLRIFIKDNPDLCSKCKKIHNSKLD